MYSHFLTIKINSNIIRNVFRFIWLIISKFNIFLNAFLREVSRNKKNFLFRRKIVKNVNYKIIV